MFHKKHNWNPKLRVYVLFRSLSRHKHTGFHLEYKAICGGEIKLKLGQEYEIMSPNFPEEYPTNSNCSWVVTSPPGYQVAFHFDQFEIERHDTCQQEVNTKILLKFYDLTSTSDISMISSRSAMGLQLSLIRSLGTVATNHLSRSNLAGISFLFTFKQTHLSRNLVSWLDFSRLGMNAGT